ncbi:hypothetical protein BSU00_00655 [Tenacibaculum sp. SG-28]|nr:hypothetical protein BSU00_00655 [Tenacibaculum sp. SG-28]
MTKTNIQTILKKETFSHEELETLQNLITKYPYFHLAKALHLKILKSISSYKYNKVLKETAAYTTDREVLFDYITSKDLKKASVTKEKLTIKSLVSAPKTISKQERITKELKIGTPLAFSKNENFSFQQWLQLTHAKEIQRKPKEKEETTPKTINTSNAAIIDRFIENNPKISRPTKGTTIHYKIEENQGNEHQLMTETLAKVYLEQKKYESAIKSYKILSLKYPEKSGFFADQIKRIKILQNNK